MPPRSSILAATFLSLMALSPASSSLAATPATPATAEAVHAVNSGGATIFRSLPEGTNLLLSPLSIQAALAMTYAGASGLTREQMGAALDFPEDATALASSFAALTAALAGSAGTGDEDVALHLANRLFGQTGFQFRPAFLDLLDSRFSAPIEELDFRANPHAAARSINQWVAGQTAGRILDLVPEAALNKTTSLVLANALYFKMPWAEEFPAALTSDRDFQNADGSKTHAPFVHTTAKFGYAVEEGWTLLALPFRRPQFQFVVFLPPAGTGPGADFPADVLLAKAASLPSRQIRLALPKFRLAPPTLALGDTLKSLGMPTAFDSPQGSADFDAMAPRKPDDYLYLSDVFHKTFFDLGEKGVEAAAATAVVMMRATSLPIQEDPIEVTIDRPFLFALQHRPDGACLFLGRMAVLPAP